MSTTSEHGRIIRDAARSILEPIGLVRKGRSRLWFSDERWWLAIVEFQPSGFEKGTHLNVAAMWLWHVRDDFTFHSVDRVSGLVPVQDETSFGSAIKNLVEIARARVTKLRTDLSTLDGLLEHLKAVDTPSSWLDQGITLGLLGRQTQARDSFDRYLDVPDDRPWAIREQERISILRGMLDSPDAFDAAIEQSIRDSRARLGIDPSIPLALH